MSLATKESIRPNAQVDSVKNQISLTTVVAYLFGSRTAILKLASNRGTIWLGLLFVISAGFAREYDGEDLLHKPSHLLLPLIASLATSMLLFGLIYLLSLRRHAGIGNFLSAYLVFLSLYWMTAPLAWLYAIPFERFMTAADAVSMNLSLLGLVSIWRVLLITRVIVVIFNARPETVFPVVMLFADTVALFLASYVPLPIMAIMGGIRLTESERIISTRTFEVMFLGALSYPIWFLSTCVVFSLPKPAWTWMVTDRQSIGRIRRSVWVVAALMNLGWTIVLPITQREQQLRFQAESLLREDRLVDAINLMSAHRQNEFPPHWDPLPNRFRMNAKPSIVDLMSIVADRENDWVHQLIVEKFQREFANHTFKYRLESMENKDRLKFLDVLEHMLQREEVLFRPRPKEPPFFPESMNSRQPNRMEVIPSTTEDVIPDEPPQTRLEEALSEFLEAARRFPEDYQLSDEVRDKTNHLIDVLRSAGTSNSPRE